MPLPTESTRELVRDPHHTPPDPAGGHSGATAPGSRPPAELREPLVLGVVLALFVVIFLVDLLTPLGYAIWVLYLLPLAVTLLQRRTVVPLYAAAAAMVLTVIGYWLSPPGQNPLLSITNRIMASISFWAVAWVIRQVLATAIQQRRSMWLKQAEATLAQALLGDGRPEQIGDAAGAALCRQLDAAVAVLYQAEGEQLLRCGGHAFDRQAVPERIARGDGLVGQVATDGRARSLPDLAAGHLTLRSALGQSAPRQVVVAPVTAEGQVCGVIELGFARSGVDLSLVHELAAAVGDNIGAALRSASYRLRLQELLEETRRQAEELQAQQEELRTANEELEEQSHSLRESQAELEIQQTELERSNAQLSEHSASLEQQRHSLLQAQGALEDNARQLQTASRYKSEFLANMSHELRTPLNSSLILSKLLVDNKEATLTAEQVKFAEAIHASNNDLLLLINDILDLSKIEAGHVDLQSETTRVSDLLERMRSVFEPVARQKQLTFEIEAAPDAPATLQTDPQRLQQVLKNLLANAMKFTERGKVRLAVRAIGADCIGFDVQDTGLGIAAEQQEVIFEAFRQADGSTSRRFGGTGLGLSISRELVHRMGGTISVRSEPGEGSTFTIELPLRSEAGAASGSAPAAAPTQPKTTGTGRAASPAAASVAALPTSPASSRESAAAVPPAAAPSPTPHAAAPASSAHETAGPPADAPAPHAAVRRVILAVEDDLRFAEVLRGLAREMGFECVVASTGSEGLRLARELQPSGILLDVGLPDQSGLGVLEQLKRDADTRHLPVHVISSYERSQTAMELGAIGYVLKPAAREELARAIDKLQSRLQRAVRHVLVVEDDAALRDNLRRLLETPEVEITAVGSVADALAQLSSRSFDCLVTDLSLPDGSGFDLLERMAEGRIYGFPPVIVYTGRALSRDEEQRLRRYSRSIIVKGARSPERLLDEVTLFLHSVETQLPAEQQRLLRQARQRDTVLEGRRVLLAEDDVRNVFALTSIFEPLGVKLEVARNGREAVDKLEQLSDIDLVLMDVMMPEMDGLTAMRLIRKQQRSVPVPIIALTAKAMANDREECLAAGANDYLAKPIDVDKLISLCRVWMPK